MCCFLVGKHEERKKIVKPWVRCEDDIKMVVKKGKGLRCVRPGKSDLWEKNPERTEKSLGPGSFY